MEEIKKLERNLQIPISEINFNEKHVELRLNGSTIGAIKYIKNEEDVIFDFSDESEGSLNWKLIVDIESERIRPLISDVLKRNDFKVEASDYPMIKILNQEGNLQFSAACVYEDGKWHLHQDTNFELSRRENEIKALRNQLTQNNYHIQQNNYLEHQNRLIDTVADKGLEMFSIWIENQSKNEKQEIELMNEFEKQELNVVSNLDKRDKIFKGTIVGTCLILMGVLGYYEKAGSILPLIGVIIGLVLQSDSISKYFSGSAKKRNSMIDEE